MTCRCGKEHPIATCATYYVAAEDGERWAPLLGPFKTYFEASRYVETVKKAGCIINPRAWKYKFVVHTYNTGYEEPGLFNVWLGFDLGQK